MEWSGKWVGGAIAAGIVVVAGIVWGTYDTEDGDGEEGGPSFEAYEGGAPDDGRAGGSGSRVAAKKTAERRAGRESPSEAGGQAGRRPEGGGADSASEKKPSSRRDEPRRADGPGHQNDGRAETERRSGGRASADAGTGDGGGRGDRDEHEYEDPVHQKVLGPRRWMGELPDEEVEAIDKDVNREAEPEYPVALADRREAVGRVTGIVDQCFEELTARRPRAAGQLVVDFELVIDEGTARLEALGIRDVVDLEEPRFLECIRRAAVDVQFAGERDGRMTVEYPFFLGDYERGPGR